MKEQWIAEFPNEFTSTLAVFLGAPAPFPAYISGLERQLVEQQTKLQRSRTSGSVLRRIMERFSASLNRRKWQYAAIMLLAVLVLVLLSLGPRRVLAQVEHWLGYVPNVGFVDLIDARVLASPVEVTRTGVTLRVEKVIASHSRTDVVFSNPGLTEQDLPWPNEAIDNSDFSAYLLLPDGTRLEMTKWEISVGSGKLEFPALPAGVYQLILLVPRLPLVPAGALPEDWEIPLTLLPANGKLIEELFPQPYSPPNACDTQHGITLCIANVAQSSKETAVQYNFLWTNPDFEYLMQQGWDHDPELRDNLGHIYNEKMDSNGSSMAVVGVTVSEASPGISASTVLSKTDMLVFPVLSLSASQATLRINSLEYRISATGSFRLDLGDNPQIGDAWPLDIHFEVAGIPIHLTGARLQTETEEIDNGQFEQYPALEFTLDPLEQQGGISLSSVDLQNEDLHIYGNVGRGYTNGKMDFLGKLSFRETGSIPSGIITLQVTGAEILVDGPWEAIWDIPGKDQANVVLPVRLKPTPPSQPDGEIQPVIQEVFLSDRLTAIHFGAINLPAGITFTRILPYTEYPSNPLINPIKLYMEDNLGYRYPFSDDEVILQSSEEQDNHSRWVYFTPMQLFAKAIHAHIPAIELNIAGQASFTVDIPQNPTFKEKKNIAIGIGGGGSDPMVTMTSWATDPWSVDIRFDIAGYELQLDQALLVHDEYSSAPYQLILTGNRPARIQSHIDLYSLVFSKIETPDGQVISTNTSLQDFTGSDYPNAVVAPTGLGSSHYLLIISLDVTAPNRVDLGSGRYQLDLTGALVWDSGPWDLHLPLPGH